MIDGETMCECGHVRDEHGEDWCVWIGPAGEVDDCIEFRPVSAQTEKED